MALSLTSTALGSSSDYQRYLEDIPTKSDRVNDPDLLDFTLASTEDPAFVKLVRGNYITFTTDTYGVWFTGYITNDPEPEYIGLNKLYQPVWKYKYQATSDDIILNHQPLGYVPPYINTTQGKVLKDLVARLDPLGTFDTTGITDGIALAYYAVDPTKKFGEIVKEFGDASFYRFRSLSHKLFYRPADADLAGIIIDGNDLYFTPSSLSIQQSQQDIVNDVTVLGEVEAQSYMNEYFIGDAFTAKFPLLAGVYGIARSIILDETFSGDIDESIWDIVGDPGGAFLVVSNGYLNCISGNNTGNYDIYLASINTVALEGNMRWTHGEWDFVSASSGVIASMWTQAPNNALTGCIYGLKCTKSGASTVITPVINGVEDLSQTFTVDYTKRYVFRTLVNFQHLLRLDNRYAYINSAGVVVGFGGDSTVDQPRFHTIITTIDPTNGNILAEDYFTNTSTPLTNAQLAAFYVPLASDDLNATVTSITLSRPLDAYLEEHRDVRLGFDGVTGFQQKMIGPNDLDAQDGFTPVATIVDSGGGSAQTKVNLNALTYNPSHAALEYFKDSAKQSSDIPAVATMLHLAYRRAGLAIGRVIDPTSIAAEAAAWGDSGRRALAQTQLNPLPRNSSECELAAAAIVGDGVYQHYEGTYEMYSLFSFTSEPLAGTVLKFQNMDATAFPGISNEVILEVTTEFVAAKPREIFKHTIRFGRATNIANRILATLGADQQVPQGSIVPQDTVEASNAIDILSVGTTFAPDVLGPYLTGWNPTDFTYDTGQACPVGGGFEIRYTDSSWGTDPAKNLVERITSGTTFTVPRTNRGKTAFIKAYDAAGNYSRYSSGLRANLPLIPPAPTANINMYDQAAPRVEIILPPNLMDVWGYEIRASDNVTVLDKHDLSDSGSTLFYTQFGNNSRSLSYYVYTYNLLGEYSLPYNAVFNLSDSTIDDLTVDDNTMNVKWVGSNATGYIVEIDNVDGTMTHIVLSARTGEDQVFKLPELHFFEERWIAVTPFDDLGEGISAIYHHVYIPNPPLSFDADEVISVQPPLSATVPAPNPPNIATKYQTDYQTYSQQYVGGRTFNVL